MYYKDECVRLKNEMEARKNDLLKELESLPDGELCIRNQAGRRYFYARLKKEGNRKKEHRIGLTKDLEMLGMFARKKYIQSAVDVIEKNIVSMDKMINNYIPSDENSVMKDFLIKYPELAEGVYAGKHNYAEWAEAYTAESGYHEENLKSTAADGTRRRSKGELLIGAKLDHYGIPYRYEAPAHPDLSYIPDFTIRRPRDGRHIYWEHLGLVNDREYMDGYRRKFAAYEEVGIVPWENLIITYDQSDGGINEKLIDAMIQGWLL